MKQGAFEDYGTLLGSQPRLLRKAVLRSFHISQPGGHASVGEALEGEQKAQRQEENILEFFRYHDQQGPDAEGNMQHTRWTPSEVHNSIFGMAQFLHEVFDQGKPRVPLTSVRRAISNLTKRGLLTHWRSDRRPGPLGAKESTWSLVIAVDDGK